MHQPFWLASLKAVISGQSKGNSLESRIEATQLWHLSDT